MPPNVRWILLGAVVLLLAAGGWLYSRKPAEVQQSAGPRVWNYSVWGSPRAFTSGIERIAQILHEESGGQLEMKIHYGSAISPEKENIDSIKLGSVEAAHICFAYHPGKVPLTQVLDLPFLLTEDMRVNARVMDVFFHHPLIEKDLAEHWNVKYLSLIVLPNFEFMGNRRIASAADMKGLRLRVLGGYGPLIQDVGAVPTMVTAPEVYTAIERGTIDAVMFPWTDTLGSFRIYEVSKYATLGVKTGALSCISGVSVKAWNALPGNLQALLPRLQKESMETYFKAYEDGDAKWLPIFKQHLEVVPFPQSERDKLVALSKPHWEKWAKGMDAQGQPGTEILRFIQDEIEKARRELGR